MWSALPRPQKRVVTLRYSPCAGTPPAATLLPLAVQSCSDTPPVVTATVAVRAVLVHGLYLEVTMRF
jgi:hypothetical protein